MNYRKASEIAELWGITARQVQKLCKEGKISGAKLEGRCWMIPEDAIRPSGRRRRTDRQGFPATSAKKMLPIGISDFRKAVTDYYYVDKTLLIKDFLDTRPQVSLFTRPRRFGKTLNMDMLRVFFEISDMDTSVYFKNQNIWRCGPAYQMYQGRYPVIFMTFKDVKFHSWAETLEKIKAIVQEEFLRHNELLTSSALTEYETGYFQQVLNHTLPDVHWTGALSMLSQMLDKHYGVAPVIIVDEYDIPIQQGHMSGFYEDVILFLRNFFSAGVKDNPHLSFAFLTGILRVAKESIFSGMNNLKINSILEERYSSYFGFTAGEIREMLQYYGAPEKYEELRAWYDGYRFGSTEIFNPWSVINYIDENCFPKAFWQSTGSNGIIGEIIGSAPSEVMENLEMLMQGQSILTYVDTGVIYPEIRNNPSSIYSFLLVAGYLKAARIDPQNDGNFMCEVAIPNREIFYVYEKEILSKLDGIVPQSSAIAIQQAIYAKDIAGLQKHLAKLLQETISFHDAAAEGFYHGLVIGLCAVMNNRYRVTSNREAGGGRYDLQMYPYHPGMPAILMELKAARNPADKLEKLAQSALLQMDDRQYDSELVQMGCKSIIKFGIAFYKKQVHIACAEMSLPSA